MADEAKRIGFQDLVFCDENGALLPTVRPFSIWRSPHGMLHFRVDKVGNGQDLWETVCGKPGPDLGPGLRKRWKVLHPLLG